jgi:hypothetical protein
VVDASSSGLAFGVSTPVTDSPSASSPVAASEPSAALAAAPGLPSTRLAMPARALQPPTFDMRNTFPVLALALAGAWIVSRRWRTVVAARN